VPSPVPLEQLWKTYIQAEESGERDTAARTFAEIRRIRTERNIKNHETIGLALVAEGVEAMEVGDRDEANLAFIRAVNLAPGLPDGYFGRAVTLLKQGLLYVVPSIRASGRGLLAFLTTARGELRMLTFVLCTALLALFLVVTVVAVALLIRHGGLLRHDIEEWLGPAQSPAASLALWLLLVLFPLAAFQGWGWLPLWWLALLFAYLNASEKAIAVFALLVTVLAGPALDALERWQTTVRNPLFEAALAAVEAEPDARQVALLEATASAHPEDRNLAYLLALAWRRSGDSQRAANLYQRLLESDPNDAVARNNLANLEFIAGEYDKALQRYREGAEAGGRPAVVATSFYNLSIAHLEKFEYQAFNEAKGSADRLAGRLIEDYDRWKYDSGDYAVVDLVPSLDDVWRRFAGRSEGLGEAGDRTVGLPRGIAGLASRFTLAAALFVLVAFVVTWVRGRKAFTVHCSRCGMAFCRQCHLGKVVGDLCSQCHHLFVVRDGVSGPARNRKMLEVQGRERRRSRVFRILSVLSPGAGQVYGRQTLLGFFLVTAWYGILSGLLTSRLLHPTEVSSLLMPPWGIVLAVSGLVVIWVVANRFPPDFDAALPKGRPSRSARAGQAG
jgi:tetratricopeptide (TPR) repeat protein